jgi:antitoxin (DNA-binding transcriptional repressor) of toxin-antitoxin stability system
VTIGTKDLKNNLSHYLRRVREGEVVRVTDRGKVIAELRAVPPSEGDEQQRLVELEGAGIVTRGSAQFATFRGVRLKKGTAASRAILADRR